VISAQAVIDEARRWLGTPYQHQARLLGVGVDCAGLIMGIGKSLGLLDVDYRGYSDMPHGGTLRAICDKHLTRIAEPEPGAVALMSWATAPGQEQHLAVLTERGTIIHAHAHVGGCVEHRYALAWQARTRTLYRLPGVTWQL
jgi:NlpC/P60 family putative phage cell wall peptidase